MRPNDTSHLSALITRLTNERNALARATKQGAIKVEGAPEDVLRWLASQPIPEK